MENGSKVRWTYLLPPAITLVIYSIILAVKGICPFGNNTIDYYDMAQQIAAFYYHVYDALHGTKGFFYDWYTALGVNMAMSTSGCSNISPFNLFFLLIRRSSLLKSLSVFNGIKLMCMSASMYFYLNKTHAKSPAFFKLAASVGYSFCGFVLVLYITNQWIDIAVMFPLIMYFYDRLIKTGKMTGYVITLAITLIASYYLSFMILIFIFLYTGVILAGEKLFLQGRTESLKEEASDGEIKAKTVVHVAELGLATVLGLLLSSFILIPQLTQMLSSARFKNGNGSESTGLIGKYLEILSHVRGDYTTRWWSLLGISFMAAVIVTGLINCFVRLRVYGRKSEGEKAPDDMEQTSDNKEVNAGIAMTDIVRCRPVLTTAVLILIMVLELFIESINLIWHFGSYVQYPIRNGFIIYFVFAYLACYFAGELYGDRKPAPDRSYLGFIFTIIAFLIFIAVYKNHPGMQLRTVFHMTSAMMALTFLFYLVLLNYEELRKSLHIRRDKRIEEEMRAEEDRRNGCRYRWAAGVLVFEVLCYGFLLFGRPDFITGYAEEPEQNGEYINICEQLRDKLELSSEFLYRVKNPDTSLNANYGLVLMQPALSNWTHMIAPGEQGGAARWGYSIQFTRLLDSGGTVFSDALLGVRKVISRTGLDERLYEPVSDCTVNDLAGNPVTYTMYRPKYTLPFGVVINSGENADKEIETALKDKDTVSLHNVIYDSMKRSAGIENDRDMAHWLIRGGSVKDEGTVIDESVTKSERRIVIKVKADDETALYLMGNRADGESGACTIEVFDGAMDPDKDETGRFIPVPTIGDPGNIRYPIHFNNNAVYLGCYKEETVTLRIIVDTGRLSDFELNLMGLSMDALEELCGSYGPEYDERIEAGGSELAFTAEGRGEDSRMLLPLTYDKGWKIIRNGHKIKAESYAGLFTVMPLENGENTVNMKFTPPGMPAGVIVTLIALVVSVLLSVMVRIRKDTLPARIKELGTNISSALSPVYIVVFTIALLFMYLIPIIYGMYILAAR